MAGAMLEWQPREILRAWLRQHDAFFLAITRTLPKLSPSPKLDRAPTGAGRLHAERASCSLDHVFGLVVTEVVLAPESAGGARDLGQVRVRLRFYRLTTPFRPVNPLHCAHGAFR